MKLPYNTLNKNLRQYQKTLGRNEQELCELKRLLELQRSTQSNYNKEVRDAVMMQIQKEQDALRQRKEQVYFVCPANPHRAPITIQPETRLPIHDFIKGHKGRYRITVQTIHRFAGAKTALSYLLPDRDTSIETVENDTMSYQCDIDIVQQNIGSLKVCIGDDALRRAPYDDPLSYNTIRYLYIDDIAVMPKARGKGYGRDLSSFVLQLAQANQCDIVASRLSPDDKASRKTIIHGKRKQGFTIEGSFCYKVLTPKGHSFVDGSFFK